MKHKHTCVPFGAGPNKHCVPFGAYRVSRLVPCLDLAVPAILPMGTSSLQPCTETLFGRLGHNYRLSRLFKWVSNSLWLWVGPWSWLANYLMVLGSQILCNNGRYEFLTTSIAEVFVTRMSKRCLISWRWHKDWAVFQSVVVTSLLRMMLFVHFYLTIRYDFHRRDCRVDWRKMLLFCHWLGANILPLSG